MKFTPILALVFKQIQAASEDDSVAVPLPIFTDSLPDDFFFEIKSDIDTSRLVFFVNCPQDT